MSKAPEDECLSVSRRLASKVGRMQAGHVHGRQRTRENSKATSIKNADELPNNASEFPVKWGVAGTRCQIGDCGKQQRPRVEKPQKWTADQEGKLELKSCHQCVQGTQRRVPVGFKTPGIQGRRDAGRSCSQSPKNSGELQGNQQKINADELPNNASEFQ